MPAATEQQAEAVAVLGESLAGVDDVVRQHALIAGLNLVIACGLGGLVGPVLIRRALRPLRRIAGTTKRIAAGDLSQRVDLTGPDDEIGELSRSFDHMAASLEHAFTELADSEARVRSFVADARHTSCERRSPPGGYTDVLLRDGTDPEGARCLLVGLRREVSRMQRLVDDLLTLARLAAGAPLELASTDLRDLAGEVAEQLRPLAGARDLSVRGPAVVAEVDADRIRQVLVNLVANALRHTSDRGSIGIELGTGASGVRIEVTDDGEGMDEATGARAFTRFARGTDNRSGRGSGLGLAIVHAIVTAHGGGVEIRSAPGEGTAVAVTLPNGEDQSARSAYPTLRTV